MEQAAIAPRVTQAVFAAGAVALWFVLTQGGAVSPLFLPPPDAVWNALLRLVQSDEFWPAVRVTSTSVAAAYGIAAIAGVSAGWALTRSPLLTRAFEPLVSGTFAIPITLF